MSKKKGLSVDEKRKRMIEFFFETKDFYMLKELERILPKTKGITSMTVKDILTSLVDDGLVDTDKIGTCCYFWAFPSKAGQIRKRKIEELESNLDTTRKKLKATQEKLTEAKIGKDDTGERQEALASLREAQKTRDELTARLESLRDRDPEVVKQMAGDATAYKDAANRWTENIFSTMSWVKNKFHYEASVLHKQFEIPEDLDYL